ncbi:MAG: chemotaxis protein CheX [Phycisphaerales bacterium]
MTEVTGTRLAEMTIEMLERTAMLLAEPSAAISQRDPLSHVARITFRGPTRGVLHLAASEGFVRELAAGLLGVEPADVDVRSHGNDALREMANIVAGSVILALSGAECEYSLGLPELIGELPSQANAGGASECTVATECGQLRVSLVQEAGELVHK